MSLFPETQIFHLKRKFNYSYFTIARDYFTKVKNLPREIQDFDTKSYFTHGSLNS